MAMRIGITYNLKDEPEFIAGLDSEYSEEFDSSKTIDAICDILVRNGFEAVRLGWSIDIIDRVKKEKIDFIFNLAEGYHGRNRESHMPSILEMINIPHSGSDALTLGMTLDKTVTKKILSYAGIPNPAYYIAKGIECVPHIENHLQYPMITKPAWEGSSKGIYNLSRVFSREELEENLKILFNKYPNQPTLVEEYIKGREITAGVIGNNPPQILGLMEIRYKDAQNKDFFYSLEVKRDWKKLVKYITPPAIPQSLDMQIRKYALTAFKDFGCRDIARIDFRISEYGEPFILELNPLPGLSPEYADLVLMVRKLGISYETFILDILHHAFERYGFVKKKINTVKNTLIHENI